MHGDLQLSDRLEGWILNLKEQAEDPKDVEHFPPQPMLYDTLLRAIQDESKTLSEGEDATKALPQSATVNLRL